MPAGLGARLFRVHRSRARRVSGIPSTPCSGLRAGFGRRSHIARAPPGSSSWTARRHRRQTLAARTKARRLGFPAIWHRSCRQVHKRAASPRPLRTNPQWRSCVGAVPSVGALARRPGGAIGGTGAIGGIGKPIGTEAVRKPWQISSGRSGRGTASVESRPLQRLTEAAPSVSPARLRSAPPP